MSYSFHSADRSTHYKVIAVAFVLSLVVGLVGLSARTDTRTASEGTGVVKATKSVVTTQNAETALR
jgi:hypothetical protein